MFLASNTFNAIASVRLTDLSQRILAGSLKSQRSAAFAMWLCGSTTLLLCLPLGICDVCTPALSGLEAEDALARAPPAWHALSPGKSMLLYKEQVGEKAQHFRADCTAARGGIPLQRIGTALKVIHH